MSLEPTAILRASGFLPKKYSDDLLGYFYVACFGGVYEDMTISGVEVLFPKCRPAQVAVLRANLEAPDLKPAMLARMLSGFRFSAGRDIRTRNVATELRDAGFEEVRHDASGAISFLGARLGLIWSFHLRANGTLLAVEAHDVPLNAANAEDRSFTEDRIRSLIIEQLKTSTREGWAEPQPQPSASKSRVKKRFSETTKRLVACGFLPKNFKEELFGDFYLEGFDGFYEELEIGGVQLLFPKCAGTSVAALRCSLECDELDREGLAKVLEKHGFAASPGFAQWNYQRELREAGFEEVIHEASGAVNFIGERLEITWAFHLRKDGTLLFLDAHNVPLVAANAARMTEEEIRDTLVQWLKTSARR